MKKISNQEFLERAREKHENKFIYLSPYIAARKLIKIKCLIHGIFEQSPLDHLRSKYGCAVCAGMFKKTHVQFVQEANGIHQSKYSYPEEYKGCDDYIDIYCHIHGIFKQKPTLHLAGQQCPPCAHLKIGDANRLTMSEFLEKAKKLYGNTYKYLDQYAGDTIKMRIECPIHGIFLQTPHNHIHNNGCKFCSWDAFSLRTRKTHQVFVEQANTIHQNKYKYLSEYIGTHHKILIECPMHGEFRQAPCQHLAGGQCLKCSLGNSVSQAETQWLNYLGIANEYRNPTLRINKRLIKPDAYDPNTNTLYEFYGSFWHGDPKIFDPIKKNGFNKKTFGELYRHTMEREQRIKEAGYNFVFIWERDWNNLRKDINE